MLCYNQPFKYIFEPTKHFLGVFFFDFTVIPFLSILKKELKANLICTKIKHLFWD